MWVESSALLSENFLLFSFIEMINFTHQQIRTRIFVYPYTYNGTNSNTNNPYIFDFINSLKSQDFKITNEFSKSHPLLGIIKYVNSSDVFVFHWLENVKLYKFGLFQFLFALGILQVLKKKKKKIVWFRHNFKPHNVNSLLDQILCQYLINSLKSKADLIITHSKKGLSDLEKEKNKSFYIIHPTKNRGVLPKTDIKYDLLIWGNISKYKGVLEFLEFNYGNESLRDRKIKIVGNCPNSALLASMIPLLKKNVSFENRPIEFEELKFLVSETRYILIPYASESVLSSGILMDSLSVGASVIGPNIGAFKDLKEEKEVNVMTFNNFKEISSILGANTIDSDYTEYLNRHNWIYFSSDFRKLINKIL